MNQKGIAGSTLKLIAMISMFIDHIGAVCLETYLRYGRYLDNASSAYAKWYANYHTVRNIDIALRLVGRFAFPIYAFLLIEGFYHTRSRSRYARNLLLFALISEIPFDLAFRHAIIDFTYQNVFFTLLLALLTLCLIDWLKSFEWNAITISIVLLIVSTAAGVLAIRMLNDSVLKNYIPFNTEFMVYGGGAGVLLGLLLLVITSHENRAYGASFLLPVVAMCTIAELIHCDYGAWGVLTVAVMWLLYQNTFSSVTVGCSLLFLSSLYEVSSFFVLLPICYYNGKRGVRMKYLFYLYYPLHLLLLTAVVVMQNIAAFHFMN